MHCIVGVDFDNTLVSYDEVLHKAAVDFGFIQSDTSKSKMDIRNRVRHLPQGEKKWQRLQAFVYGKAMDGAVLIEGVENFFEFCSKTDVRVYVISHKTEFAAADEEGINLREVALAWMKKNKLFDKQGLALSPEAVYFESSRQGKIARLRTLGCTHFIDDLEETFLDKTFPRTIEKILYDPHAQADFLFKDIKVFNDWNKIHEYFADRERQGNYLRCA